VGKNSEKFLSRKIFCEENILVKKKINRISTYQISTLKKFTPKNFWKRFRTIFFVSKNFREHGSV